MKTTTGTAALAGAIVRRDRIRITAWVLAVGGLVVVTASSIRPLYPTQADLDEAAVASANSAIARAFGGPPVALNTLGGQVAFQILVYGAIAAALMSILTVARLTRGEEEGGRTELLLALPVGRGAPLAAALAVTAVMDVAVGAITAGGFAAMGLPLTGSVLIGAGFAALAWCFAGLTALGAQLAESARAAAGIAGAALAVAFTLRAIGDVGDGAVSWASPIGWAQKAQPYAANRAWPLLLLVATGAAATLAAARLDGRRDLGAGLLPPRRGPARAGAHLATPLGLAARLQRAALAWWTIGLVAGGAIYGALAKSIADFVGDNEAVHDVIGGRGGSLTDSYLATALLIVALIACGQATQSVLRLRGEEVAGRAEAVLTAAVSRPRWMASHLVLAFGVSAGALAAGGVAMGIAAGVATGDGDIGVRTAVASLAYAPAVWVVAAAGVVLFGALPRWTALAWLPLVVAAVDGLFGTLLGLPQAVMDLSPFTHTPAVPAQPWQALPVTVLVVLAAVGVVAGTAALRHRDVPA